MSPITVNVCVCVCNRQSYALLFSYLVFVGRVKSSVAIAKTKVDSQRYAVVRWLFSVVLFFQISSCFWQSTQQHNKTLFTLFLFQHPNISGKHTQIHIFFPTQLHLFQLAKLFCCFSTKQIRTHSTSTMRVENVAY